MPARTCIPAPAVKRAGIQRPRPLVRISPHPCYDEYGRQPTRRRKESTDEKRETRSASKNVEHGNRLPCGAFIGDAASKPRRLGGKTQPEFHSSSRLEWPRNSTLLYAHDASGVWSAEADVNARGWKLEVKAEGVHTFHVTSWARPVFFIVEGEPPPEPEIVTTLTVETDGNPVFSRARESGFVPMAGHESESAGGSSLKPRIGGRFGDGATLGTNVKERRITQINLTDEKEKIYHRYNGWEAGEDGPPHNCWMYHANFYGLHVTKGEGFCALGFTLFYNE